MKSDLTFKQIATNIMALFSGTAVTRVFSAVTLIVIARLVGRDAFGQYSASMALATLSSSLFALGLDGWLMYEGGRQRDMINARLTSAVLIKVFLGIIWLAGLWTIAPFLNRSSFPWALVVLSSLSVWLDEIARTVVSGFKAALRNSLTLVQMAWFPGAFFVTSLWLVFHQSRDPGAYLAARLLAAFVGATVAIILATRKLGWRLQLGAFLPTLRGVLPFTASALLTTVYHRADLTIVANELGKEAAGIYSPALTLTNALFLVPAALFGVLMPAFSRADHHWTRKISSRLIPGMALIGLMLGLTLVWLSTPLIKLLYGEAFLASAGVLSILAGVLALRFPNNALAAVIVAAGLQRHRVAAQALATTLNVFLNLKIVHSMNVEGVAKVYVLSEVVLFIGYLSVYIVWMRKQRQSADTPESW